MGRIKTKQIKRLTKELMKQNDAFTKDFGKNKEIVDSAAQVRSKKLRNVIAGYAVRLTKEQEAKAV